MKNFILLSALLIGIASYGQTKKQQIILLNARADSLSALLEGNRAIIKDLNRQLDEKGQQLNSCTDSLNSERKTNTQFQTQYDQLALTGLELKVKDHIRSFYDCLELSDLDNIKAYDDYLTFYKTDHKKFLKNTTSYSKERVSNLTGDYHDRFDIHLLSIDSITITETTIVVKTMVEYWIYEGGNFQNMEEIVLIRKDDELLIASWYDIKSKKTLPNYSIRNYSNKQMLKMLGTNPK